MKLRLTIGFGDQREDVVAVIDTTVTVGMFAARLASGASAPAGLSQKGLTLAPASDSGPLVPLSAEVSILESGIRSGDVLHVVDGAGDSSARRRSIGRLRVIEGVDLGREFPLGAGVLVVGRDAGADVALSDDTVSRRHLRLSIGETVDLIDENSANGVFVDGEPVQRTELRSGQTITIGESKILVELDDLGVDSDTGLRRHPTLAFNRSPRLNPRYQGTEHQVPEPPSRPQRQRVPIAPMLAPLLMAAVMYAVTRNALSVLFAALSPLMIVGSYLENTRNQKRALIEATEAFHENLGALRDRLAAAFSDERSGRMHENPSLEEVVSGVFAMTPLMWTRRPEEQAFLELRLGLGRQVSRHSVKLPSGTNPIPELWYEVLSIVDDYSTIDDVPIVAGLRDLAAIGLSGPEEPLNEYAAGVVAQLVGLHSPAEVVLAAIVSRDGSERWNWLKWLPHVDSEHSPIECEHLAATPSAAAVLMGAIDSLIEERSSELGASHGGAVHLPVVVVLVEDEAVDDRARLVDLIERGGKVGVHMIWTAPSMEHLPAACRVFVNLGDDPDAGFVGFLADGGAVTPLRWESIDRRRCTELARWLSPVSDASSLVEDQTDLPRSISFLTLAGPQLAEDSADVVERWRGSNSLPPESGASPLRRDNTLRALVGQASGDRFYLDLRTDGPHALVGGTTGAGKSEFLQSWVLGIASAHSPSRVNFLFVDYKGGAAFAECVRLPHCVGLVTDLNQFLVRRALRSLNAELRRREHVLTAKKAKDLMELERRRDPEAPPSLVIVVDEFAALVSEVPEFVDGVVNVAQRGRSLGLHLVLATQRPAGVIKDNLRANTNLRVAMRMADESDSMDVLGSTHAANFDPSIPGRSMAKSGPRSLTAFQSAYVGGVTSSTPPPPSIDIWQYEFGVGLLWDLPKEALADEADVDLDPDIVRIVDTISDAFDELGLPEPQRPWLPELASTYVLEDLQRTAEDGLVFGTSDLPDLQAQALAVFRPDLDGNMVVFGTGGSGRSALLRSIAHSAAQRSASGDPHVVYALDMSTRSMQLLDVLPNVGSVVVADEHERIANLLRMLRSIIDERGTRFAAIQAGSLPDYRERSGNAVEPRIVLLVDGYGAFRQTYEIGPHSALADLFQSIVADGRAVGVHVVLTVDRWGAVPASLAANLQRRVVLRLASEIDYASLDVDGDMFTAESPPGRGLLGEVEIQTAVPGGTSSVARQASILDSFAAELRSAGVPEAPAIRALPTNWPADDAPPVVDGAPVLGMWDETLEPITFDPASVFLVAGPPGSGRTSTVSWMVHALASMEVPRRFVLVSASRSALENATNWASISRSVEEIRDQAFSLTEAIRADQPDSAGLVVVIEAIGDLLGTGCDDALVDLIATCRTAGRTVVVEGERSSLGGSWPLLMAARSGGTGIALQPEQFDGTSLFKTEFPRLVRSDYPPGRGLFVRRGRIARVQIPFRG